MEEKDKVSNEGFEKAQNAVGQKKQAVELRRTNARFLNTRARSNPTGHGFVSDSM